MLGARHSMTLLAQCNMHAPRAHTACFAQRNEQFRPRETDIERCNGLPQERNVKQNKLPVRVLNVPWGSRGCPGDALG
eukprot:11186382-Lingulodinium_polyedra.AAC.1